MQQQDNSSKTTDEQQNNYKDTTTHTITIDEQKYSKIQHLIPQIKELTKAKLLSMIINKHLNEKDINNIVKEYIKELKKRGEL